MPAPIVHFELGFKDAAKAEKFYGPLFGWEFTSHGPASMITNLGHGSGSPGIGGHLNQLGHPPHNYCLVYAMVDDIPATLAKIAQLGGSTLVPQQEVPGMGWFAWFKDPEGNVVGLWKAMQM